MSLWNAVTWASLYNQQNRDIVAKFHAHSLEVVCCAPGISITIYLLHIIGGAAALDQFTWK